MVLNHVSYPGMDTQKDMRTRHIRSVSYICDFDSRSKCIDNKKGHIKRVLFHTLISIQTKTLSIISCEKTDTTGIKTCKFLLMKH